MLPSGLRAWLDKFREFFRELLSAAKRLLELEAAGKLDGKFSHHLAASVGLDSGLAAALVGEPAAMGALLRGEASVWDKGTLADMAELYPIAAKPKRLSDEAWLAEAKQAGAKRDADRAARTSEAWAKLEVARAQRAAVVDDGQQEAPPAPAKAAERLANPSPGLLVGAKLDAWRAEGLAIIANRDAARKRREAWKKEHPEWAAGGEAYQEWRKETAIKLRDKVRIEAAEREKQRRGDRQFILSLAREIDPSINSYKEAVAFLKKRGEAKELLEDDFELVSFQLRAAERAHLVDLRLFLDGDPVAKLRGDEFPKVEGRSLVDRVAAWYEENKLTEVQVPNLGVVRLDKRAVQRSWEHGKGPIKGHVFAAVPDVLRKGRLALEEPLKGSTRGGLYRHIVAPVEVGGEAYVVDVQLKSEDGSSRMYVHEVRARKRLQQDQLGVVAGADATGKTSDSTGAGETLLQRIYGVKLGALDLAKRGEVEQATYSLGLSGARRYEQAKAAGHTELSAEQWAQVRSPEFKSWFGDWEGLRAQKGVEAMEPVELSLDEKYRGAGVEDLRKAVVAYLRDLAKSGAKAEHPELGEVGFSTNKVGKVINTSASKEKLHAALDIVRVIESAHLVGSEGSSKKGQSERGVLYHTLAAKTRAFGREFVTIVTVQESSAGQLFYNNIAVESGHEKAPSISPRGAGAGDPDATSALHGAGVNKLGALRVVNAESVSRVVNEGTGEPLVVYHSSGEKFTVFDVEKSRSWTGVPDYEVPGFYFTPDLRTI